MRISSLLILLWAPPALAAQEGAGNELWRLAAVTLPFPPSLAPGAAASFWSPAQADPHGEIGLDLLQTPAVVGATGLIGAIRIPFHHVGSLGLIYARMGVGNLVRTTDSPDPDGESIPFYTQSGGVTWSDVVAHTHVGATHT